jgi:transcriptional regulator with XRE-family HTH domain
MSENNDYNDRQTEHEHSEENQNQEPEKEKVGDILHKERVTRRITLETIAKDMKLNVKYIKAIESNSFKDLPADPYVRVYLRSIATYLMLDPDEILNKFFEDRGDPQAGVQKEKSEKIKISVEKDSEKHSKSWIIIIVIIALLAAVSYLQQRGVFSNITKKNSAPAADTTTQENTGMQDSLVTPGEMEEDSIDAEENGESEENPDQSIKINHPKKNKGDSLKLVIKASFDSVWVQVFCDGQSWKNFVRSGEPRVFSAKDSIHLHVGDNKRLKYVLNGNNLSLPGNGVKIFKIDNEGIEVWKMKQWRETFKGRL